MPRPLLQLLALCCCTAAANVHAQSAESAWTHAADKRGPMKKAEATAFMKRLAQLAVDNHMKKSDAPQRGMMYEYLVWTKRGKPGTFLEGEALDTMHDGAWFAVAMANAFRTTGDAYYKEVLVKWQMPFYLKMLNESARLFSNDKIDIRPEAANTWKESKEWLLQGRENGFVPYWWDDGESVSIEMVGKKSELPFYPCTNELSGQPNPEGRLKGWSHGSSNHLAQDLGVMLLEVWLVLHGSKDSADQELAKQVALGAKNLQECRVRHGAGNIPAVVSAFAVTNNDTEMLKKLDAWQKDNPKLWKNHYTEAVRDFKPGKKMSSPAFADDQIYTYCSGVARNRTMTPLLARKLAFDAFTHPLLWQIYSDDAPVPPGMNHLDLYPQNFIDGKPEHLRSQHKGPSGKPVPMGSRMGPQNMIVCALALQTMKLGGDYAAIPAQISEVIKGLPGADKNSDIKAWMEREVGGGLRTWEAILNEYGYLPTAIGGNNRIAGVPWDDLSDTGGYAHLISAAAQWVMYLEGVNDWEKW